MINPDQILDLLPADRPGRLLNVQPMPGDASNRRYYRVTVAHVLDTVSYIVMELAAPEAFKQSEEKVTQNAAPAELPFVNIHRSLAAAHINVPAVYRYDAERGLLLLEDLGDLTLERAASTAAPEPLRALYRHAVDELVRLHDAGTRRLEPGCIARRRSFDVPLLLWEFNHFVEFALESQRPLRAPDRRVLEQTFSAIAHELAALPQVLTHRDFHSRNLMVQGEQIRVLDFQDALMGPRVYDLASLLRDSYVTLPEAVIVESIARYLEASGLPRSVADGAAFRRLFDLMSIQRNLKAAGRFHHIDQVKHNNRFLQYVPRTLGYVRDNLARYPELKAAGAVLADCVGMLKTV